MLTTGTKKKNYCHGVRIGVAETAAAGQWRRRHVLGSTSFLRVVGCCYSIGSYLLQRKITKGGKQCKTTSLFPSPLFTWGRYIHALSSRERESLRKKKRKEKQQHQRNES